MKKAWLVRALCLTAFLGALGLSQIEPARPPAPATHWWKGNLHTHTLNSDGDSTPDEVTRWYRDHRYNFLVLTDHNYLTDVRGLNAVHGAADRFLMIPGEEVTDRFKNKPVHVNAFGPTRLILPLHGESVAATLRNNVGEILRNQAMPSVNHPNFGWALTISDLLAAEGMQFVEVYNGHPTVNNQGGGGVPSLDEMWDALLSAGRHVYGIAVDDAHVFKQYGREFSNPGRGWVAVQSDSLTPEAILGALKRGSFYASTGVKIDTIETGGSEYRVKVAQEPWEKVTVSFIGKGGKVLATVPAPEAAYKYQGNEEYVRARVLSSSGAIAWTQPAFRR